jgi:bidirectional [NiFe] hydrogenase diaphorase subunit
MIVQLTINGKKLSAMKGRLLIDTARQNGFDIPSLCYHEAVSPAGNCRLCIVEIEKGGRTRIVSSCNYPVMGGENVRTDTARITTLRRSILKLLLPLAPDSKVLKKLAKRYGVKRSPFEGRVERLDCILCGLCIRVCSELAGAHAIDFSRRGAKRILTTPFGEETSACIACGACSEVCPTGAIAMEEAAVQRLRRSPGSGRWCRYHLMGISPGTICAMNYDCARCEIDQSMRSFYGGHPLIQRALGKKRMAEKL